MATGEESERGLSAYTRSILRAAVVDIVAAALTVAVGAFALLVGLLIWQGGTVPAWLAALLICLVLGAALRARLQVGKLRRELVGDRWKMVLSAGHSVTGQSKYNERIADTLSTLPLETGEVHAWDDAAQDDRFKANPKGTREVRALVSLPLRAGDASFGVLNVVASVPEVFDRVDISYLESLASVVSVAMGVLLQDRPQLADPQA
jgi:GAF domain-containing protein